MTDSEAQSGPVVSVVIVTYNSRSVVGNCLEALDGGRGADVQAIVVDNASVDGTAEYVETEFPWVTVIKSENNGGFADGVLLGARLVKGRAICLLNPDAVASRSVLLTLAERLFADRKLGAVAPLIVQPDGRLRIVSAGHMPTSWRMFTHYFGLSRLGRFVHAFEGHYLLPDQAQHARDVDWATGACLMMPATVWRQVGGLSTRWFMYAEDIELCHRICSHGLSVRLFPDLVITHLVGESNSEKSQIVSSAWILNLYDFFATELSRNGVDRMIWRVVCGLGLISRSLIFLLIDRGRDGLWRLEAHRFWAFGISALRARVTV